MSSKNAPSPANQLTSDIINFFYAQSPRIYAFRQSGLPVPMVNEGVFVGFRPPATTGIPDIQACIPAGVCALYPRGGGSLFVEVKIGKDRIRDSQETFIANVAACGVDTLIVKSMEDFLKQYNLWVKSY